MVGTAAVLEAFDQPLAQREFEVQPLAPGEALIKVLAAGVCGSDVHMWRGEDPRTPLPLILGHEGIGEIAELAEERTDLFGRPLAAGDLVAWERGIMCGRCAYCVIKKRPALCPTRRTYGISIGCAEPPHFRGCYAQYLHLLPHAHTIKLAADADPDVLVPATCAGATAAHAVELSRIEPGDKVLIIGPGPVGIYCLAMALDSGASEVYVMGTAADEGRLQLCLEFGAAATLNSAEMDADQRRELILDRTNGMGVDVGLDCTGVTAAMLEGLGHVAPYGTYSIPGIATPVGEVAIPVFELIARKNLNLQGVWVSDTGHLLSAIQLVQSGRYPLDRLVTHRFPLAQATEALETMERREAIKIVLHPW